MENRKHKRGREEEDKEELSSSSSVKNAKTQDLANAKNLHEMKRKGSGLLSVKLDENYQSAGIFEFPWLKEGVASKLDDLVFEDMFASSVEYACATASAGYQTFDFEQQLFRSPPASINSVEDKSEGNQHAQAQGDELDSIWVSLLNHPPEGGSI